MPYHPPNHPPYHPPYHHPNHPPSLTHQNTTHAARHSDYTDFASIGFTITTTAGKTVTVKADRCGGSNSMAIVEVDGVEKFRSMTPDAVSWGRGIQLGAGDSRERRGVRGEAREAREGGREGGREGREEDRGAWLAHGPPSTIRDPQPPTIRDPQSPTGARGVGRAAAGREPRLDAVLPPAARRLRDTQGAGMRPHRVWRAGCAGGPRDDR